MDDPAALGLDSAIGARVRSVRLARGMTLRQLASHLRVSPSTLSALENGHTGMSVSRLERVAVVLSIPVSEFLPSNSASTILASDDRTVGLLPGEMRGIQGLLPLAPPTEVNTEWRYFEPLELDVPLAAALELFVEVGYHGASIRAIAGRAGLSVPGLYHHYPSKQQLLVKILDFTMADLLARSLGAWTEGRDPVERFSFLVECLALFHTHRRVLGFVGASETRSMEGEGRARLTSSRVTQQQLVNEEIRAAAKLGAFDVPSVEEAGRAVTTLCTGLCQWFRPGGTNSAEQVAKEYVAYCLHLVGYQRS